MNASRMMWSHRASGLVALLCVVSCTTLGPPPSLSVNDQAEALSHFSLGLMADNAGELETAFDHLSKAIRIDPNAAAVYPVATSVALKLNRYDDAVHLAERQCEKQPNTLPPRLLLAQVLVMTDRLDQARECLHQAVADFPHEPDSHLALAHFLLSTQETPQAIQILDNAILIHPDNADLLHIQGTLIISSARNIPDPALAKTTILNGCSLLKRSLDINPDDPDKWTQLGYAQLAVLDLQSALAAFEEAYSRTPEDLVAGSLLIELNVRADHYGRAIELSEQLPRFTGTSPDLWLQFLSEKTPPDLQQELIDYLTEQINSSPAGPAYFHAQLGALYLERNELTEAESVLLNAQPLYPDDTRLRTAIAYLYVRQEKFELAHQAFQQLLADAPEEELGQNLFFSLNAITAAQKSDHLDDAATLLSAAYTNTPLILTHYIHTQGNAPADAALAIDMLQRFSALKPEAPEAFYYLSVFQSETAAFEDALINARQFKQLAAEASEDIQAMLNGPFYYQYAMLHERTGRIHEADRLFRKAIEIGDPETVASAQNYIAYMWAERGEKLDMGLDLIQQALAADPENPAYLDTLGWVYFMQGRYPEALTELLKACEQLNDDATIWSHIADTYEKLGDTEAADAARKKCKELTPAIEQTEAAPQSFSTSE